MNYDAFLALRREDQMPDVIHPLLKAMLLEASGHWDEAHSLAQFDSSEFGSWVHAYLHRVEGDQWNANYWYQRAGRSLPDLSPEKEWETISRALCAHGF